MFKKTITFVNYADQTRSKDFYFHLSKAELLGMTANGKAMEERIKTIVEANDGAAIIHEIRELIRLSVGVRSEDGERFVKDKAAQSNLLDSPAFDVLIMEMATNADAMTEFVKQLVPEKLQKEMAEELKKAAKQASAAPDPFKNPETITNATRELEQDMPAEDGRPAYQRENRAPTMVELREMSPEDLVRAWAYRENNPGL